QPLTTHLLLQRIDDLAPGLIQRHELLVREHVVERLDLRTNELVRPIQLLLVLGVRLEIPRHCASLPRVSEYNSDHAERNYGSFGRCRRPNRSADAGETRSRLRERGPTTPRRRARGHPEVRHDVPSPC